MFPCMYTQQWDYTVDCVSIYLAETRHPNNQQHLHHYTTVEERPRRFSKPMQAMPRQPKGQGDRRSGWAGTTKPCGAGSRKAQRPVRKRSLRYLFGPEGVCVSPLVKPCHKRRWKQGQTDARSKQAPRRHRGISLAHSSPLPHATQRNTKNIHTCAARPASHSTRLTTTHTQQHTPKHA